MDAHAHLDQAFGRPVGFCQELLSLPAGADGVSSIRERHEEFVAARGYLVAAEPLPCLAEEVPVLL